MSHPAVDAFERRYAERSGVTVEFLHANGMFGGWCNTACDDPECEGFEMMHLGDELIAAGWEVPGVLQRYRDEIEEYASLTGRLSRLLTLTANALKGEPDERTWHDWSDLPAVGARASALRASLMEAMSADDGTCEWCARLAARVATLLGEEP